MSILFDIKQDLRFQQGIEQGISLQAAEDKRIFASSLIENTDFSDAKIALLVGVSEEYVASLRKNLK
jgi:hypothetical protein